MNARSIVGAIVAFMRAAIANATSRLTVTMTSAYVLVTAPFDHPSQEAFVTLSELSMACTSRRNLINAIEHKSPETVIPSVAYSSKDKGWLSILLRPCNMQLVHHCIDGSIIGHGRHTYVPTEVNRDDASSRPHQRVNDSAKIPRVCQTTVNHCRGGRILSGINMARPAPKRSAHTNNRHIGSIIVVHPACRGNEVCIPQVDAINVDYACGEVGWKAWCRRKRKPGRHWRILLQV
jgi:hypothetical protein